MLKVMSHVAFHMSHSSPPNPLPSSTSEDRPMSMEAIPSTPAGSRLVDYEARMSKIRQKNQEKMTELRKKLDARLGIGRKAGGGEEKKKEEYGFKFPYDTLRRKRKDEEEVNGRWRRETVCH